MPTVKPNETQSDFVARCIPIVLEDGTAKTNQQAVAVCFQMYESQTTSKALTKRVGSQDLPSRAFLVVEDPEQITTWHLPVKKYEGNSLVADRARMGAAWAALHEGSRSNVYEGPNKSDAIAKLRKMYESEGLEVPKQKSLQAISKEFTGVMVGAFLPLPAAVALDSACRDLPFYVNKTPARDYHMTLIYLGDLSVDNFNQSEITETVASFASAHKPITGHFGGIGRMSKSDFGENALYVNFDSVELPQFRQDLVNALSSIGVVKNQEHGFIPHITIAYISEDMPEIPFLELPKIDFEIDKITFAFGDERYNFDLSGGIETKKSSSFTTYKSIDGKPRWVAISSNAYEDREGQIVSLKALTDDVARSDQDPLHDFGPLRWWHVGGYDLATQKATPGLDIGDCDFRMMHGKFLIESGTFRSDAIAKSFENFDGRISIRFLHSPNEPDSEGVFNKIRIFERSLLPTGKEANIFTSFKSVEEFKMTDKIKQFEEIMRDPELVADLMKSLDGYQAELDKNVKSKEAESGDDSRALVDKIKSLLSSKKADEIQTEKPDPQPVTAEAIAAAVTAGVTAAMKEFKTAEKETALKDDTEKAQTEQITNLLGRIEKLEGDFADTSAELTAAKKELGELIGEGGFRASESLETVISTTQKESAEADGLADFNKRVLGNQNG